MSVRLTDVVLRADGLNIDFGRWVCYTHVVKEVVDCDCVTGGRAVALPMITMAGYGGGSTTRYHPVDDKTECSESGSGVQSCTVWPSAVAVAHRLPYLAHAQWWID